MKRRTSPLRAGLIGSARRAGLFAMLFVLLGCSSVLPPKPLNRPNGVAVASDGSIYVMDFGRNRVVKLDQDGRFGHAFGQFGTLPNQIYFGWDLAIDSRGDLYFGNMVRGDEGETHDGAKRFSGSGQFLNEIGAVDYQVETEFEPHLPYGVDVDSRDWVYIADYGPDIVRVFAPDGQLIATLLADEADDWIDGLNDVAIDDANNLMYVSDFEKHDILQYQLNLNEDERTLTATFLRRIGKYGHEPGQFAFPQNLAVNDNNGTLYVGDIGNYRIQAFDSAGVYLRSYAPAETDNWQVMGITVDPDGNLYAADGFNSVIWIFSPDGTTTRRIEVKP